MQIATWTREKATMNGTHKPTNATPALRFEVVEARDAKGEWIVEATDDQSEGEVYMARFTGPGARERAMEYAQWKNRPAA